MVTEEDHIEFKKGGGLKEDTVKGRASYYRSFVDFVHKQEPGGSGSGGFSVPKPKPKAAPSLSPAEKFAGALGRSIMEGALPMFNALLKAESERNHDI